MSTKKQIVIFTALYAALRVFSFYFQPGTVVNSLITLACLLFTVYCLLRDNTVGWYIVAAELILGGSGNFLSFAGLSLRTWLLIVSIAIFKIKKLSRHELLPMLRNNAPNTILFGLIFIMVAFSTVRGLYFGHNIHAVVSDVVPYLFLLYYYPLKEILKSEKTPSTVLPLIGGEGKSSTLPYKGRDAGWGLFHEFCFTALISSIIGNTLFSLFTFAGFSTHIFALQDAYYHWFRDVAGGKITDLGFNFFRIVLNEQLLLVPLILVFVNKIIKHKTTSYFLPATTLLLITLSFNLTRIYLVALAFGLILLFDRDKWKRWLAVSFVSCFLFLISFTSIHLLASRGQSLGLELFGLRLQSIVSPQIEDSSLSRLLLLPKIVDKIKTHPVLGSGLGDTVMVFSPVEKKTITTTQFDWGFLEITDELGLVGLVIWLSLIVYILVLSRRLRSLPPLPEGRLGGVGASWPLATTTAFMIMTVTSPALFHVLGIVWLTVTLVVTQKKLFSEPVLS